MENREKGPGVPNWLMFLFLGTFAWGALYAIFLHGFLNASEAASFPNDMGLAYVEAEVAVIPDRTPDSISNGETTYKTFCAACHGMNLEGGVGPSLSDSEWWHGSDEETLANLVIRGVAAADTKGPNKIPMPAKGGSSISNTEVWEVIYFLSSTNNSISKNQ